MERTSRVDAPSEKYGHELKPEMAGFIALADALLQHKNPNTRLTFVDIVAQASPEDVLEGLNQTRIGELIMQEDEQMAIESDGSYYPTLDLRKENAKLDAVSVRACGWNIDKVRFSDDEYEFFEGEFDKVREISMSFHYKFSDTYAAERVSLYGSTSSKGLPSIGRSIYIPEYAETGYEGHEYKSIDDATEKDVLDFLNSVVSAVGEEPESFAERSRRTVADR